MVRGFWLFILLLFSPGVNLIKAHAEASRIIYCIGNHDATGSCWMADGPNEERLDCLITSWPIVECQSIPENKQKPENYECLALQNTGIVNQISLSCQSTSTNADDEKTDSTSQLVPQTSLELETESSSDETDQATVLENGEITGNAFQPDLDVSTYGVEQPKDFKDAF